MIRSGSAGIEHSHIARIGIPLAVALLVFCIFPALTEMYATQLREFSAWMAEIFLRVTYMDVTREGTVLALPKMSFDIIPACSGSEMLRTLLFLGILWSGIHPKITPIRKIIAVLLAALIALLANGIRLTFLLWASYLHGEVIEAGPLHTLIGLSAFAFALPGFFMVTNLLAESKEQEVQNVNHSNNMLAFTLVLSTLVYLPILSACLVAWIGTVYNQYDQCGFVFFILGHSAWFWAWRTTTADHTNMKIGSILFTTSSAIALISQFPGPNYYVLGITLMMSIFAIGVAYRNFHFAVRCLPFQLVTFLSFPKVSEIINLLLGTQGTAVPLIVKVLLTTASLIVFWFVCMPIKLPYLPVVTMARWASLMTASAAVSLVGMLYLARNDFTSESKSYVLPYLLGDQADWEGRDISDLKSYRYYRRGNVFNRQYSKGEARVGVMIVPSDGNRKAIHTPEYCQLGLGWQPVSSEPITFKHVTGKPAQARKLLLVNEKTGVRRTFIYWFGDEMGVTIANYPEFLIADTWRKLLGRNTNWSLYVVWADQMNNSAEEFLSYLPIIQPRS